jgi:hypothetical protein
MVYFSKTLKKNNNHPWVYGKRKSGF